MHVATNKNLLTAPLQRFQSILMKIRLEHNYNMSLLDVKEHIDQNKYSVDKLHFFLSQIGTNPTLQRLSSSWSLLSTFVKYSVT